MESIDVHDLPEEEARLVAAFVELLRSHHRQQRIAAPAGVKVRPAEPEFAVWPLGAKGNLSREEIYDYL